MVARHDAILYTVTALREIGVELVLPLAVENFTASTN
jgi:hypothetical protein